MNAAFPRFPRLVASAMLGASLVLSAASVPAAAQSDDMQARLKRLETDVQTLTRDVYRGGAKPSSGPGQPPPNLATDFELRLTQIQIQIEELTSKVEEAGHQASVVQDRLDKLSADVDQRLLRLEEKAGLSAVSGAAIAPADAAPPDRPPPAGNPTVLPPPAAAAPPQESGSLPSGSINDQYNYALGLLKQSDYAGAERAFAQFVKAHPKETLAGNAQYWLGESFYVRGKYKEAAVAFAEGFQKYPKSDKAMDNLLKLAVSLGELGQTADACTALKQLQGDYPNAPPIVKQRTTQERAKLKCK